ncbi:SUMO-activating enzyme subunit 2 [Halotydeus destructor]|nr:SUMO-activating enzyme subunit 2 [Halotydeus destructor]
MATVCSGTLTMAVNIMNKVFNDPILVDKIRASKVLLVGAGGIGCEVIKTLLLSGFKDVNLIDLDTIDVSNLNRQFLFNKTHVGKSKSEIAAQVAVERFSHKSLDESVKIDVKPLQGAIQSQEFDLDWFKSHTFVINALDNIAARSHVNRMCIAANVPLIESGSEGYKGQAYVIQKDASECYDCQGPRKNQKSYASCTIRNTPSQPIHCIVWGKHLFAQLFGEPDADNDVSPDVNDPELKDKQIPDAAESADKAKHSQTPSTRDWAQKLNYDPTELFEKFFDKDITYLLTMEKLWENRQKPVPLKLIDVLETSESDNRQVENVIEVQDGALKDQKLWSLKESYKVLADSISTLSKRLATDQFLVWDKDDEPALDFVTAVSNFRSHCFSIEKKSRFDVKSMAGNIIPAISSTNSIVGGITVLQAINLLRCFPKNLTDKVDKEKFAEMVRGLCHRVHLNCVSLNRKNLVAPYVLDEPNKDCLVCNTGRVAELEVKCSLDTHSLRELVEQVIIAKLNFVCPDVQVDGQPSLLYSKEDADEDTPEEREAALKRVLTAYPMVKDKTRLRVADLLQNQTIILTLRNEEVDPNENDGLFYKLKVVSEGEAKTEDAVADKGEQNLDSSGAEVVFEVEKDAESSQDSDIVMIEPLTATYETEFLDETDDDVCVIENDTEDVVCIDDLPSRKSVKRSVTDVVDVVEAEANGLVKKIRTVEYCEIIDEANP